MKKVLTFFVVTACCAIVPFSNSFAQCITNVDFNTWTQAGDPSNGDWNVTAGGSIVHQRINGQNTFFVSPIDVINARVTGTFRSTDNDDDWMGFVFGFNDPMGNSTNYDTWLFDWKQADQGNSPQGMSLVFANGNIPQNIQGDHFGAHQSAPFFDIKWDNHNNNPVGWNQNQTYQFELIYTSTRIEIYIDGNLKTTYQAQPGECFKPGRFGFYNKSQEDCFYSNFTFELYVDFTFAKNEVCVGEPNQMVFLDTCALTNSVVNQYDKLIWDYGDGIIDTINNPTVNNINPSHVYSSAGNYSVRLEVLDVNGCRKQISKSLTVNPLPDADFMAQDTCFGDSTLFTNLTTNQNPITYWEWQFGDGTSANLKYVNHLYPDSGTYNVQLSMIDSKGCRDTVSKPVEVHPQPTLSDSVVDVACQGGNSGQVFLDVNKGVGPLSYTWSNSSTSPSLLSVPAGTYDVTVTDANGCSVTNSATVNAPPGLSASWTTSRYPGGYEVSCFGGSDGSIDLTVNGGVPPYSYNWSNGSTSEDLQNVPAGNYMVTVTDTNGCTVVMDTVLTEPPRLSATSVTSTFAGGHQISCNGASDGFIDLTVNGGVPSYSYNWNNGQSSSQDLQNLSAGSYTVVITDTNNCTLTYDTTLSESADLSSSVSVSSFSGGYSISCRGSNDGQIDLSVSGGVSPYTYTWSNGSSTQDLQNQAAGQYSVTITDANGCTVSEDTTLSEPPALTNSITATTHSNGYNISCSGGSDGQIDLTVNGGVAPYTYTWSNGGSSEDLQNVPAGQYAVTVTDANGCTEDTSIVLDEPSETMISANVSSYAGGWEVSCHGKSDGSIDLTVTGGNPPYTYNWNNGQSTSEDLDSVEAGLYRVTITGANGCQVEWDTTLSAPPELVGSASGTRFEGGFGVSCHGASDGGIDLSVQGGTPAYSYTWDHQNATTQDIQNLPGGQYSVTITDRNGCRTQSTVTLTEPPSLSGDLTEDAVTCHEGSDGSATIQASGGASPYSHQWSNGLSGTSITNQRAGNYEVTVTDANGCTYRDSVEIEQPPPLELTLADTHRVVFGGEVELQPDYFASDRDVSFNWRPSRGLECEGTSSAPVTCSTPVASPLNTTSYELMMEDEAGCEISTETEVLIKKEKSLFVPNAFTPDDNGRNDKFRAYAKGVKSYRLRIYNRWGEEIFRSNELTEGWDGTVNGRKATPGTYIYTVHITYLDNDRDQQQGSFVLIR